MGIVADVDVDVNVFIINIKCSHSDIYKLILIPRIVCDNKSTIFELKATFFF